MLHRMYETGRSYFGNEKAAHSRIKLCVIWGFRCEVAVNCVAAISGNCLPEERSSQTIIIIIIITTNAADELYYHGDVQGK